MNYNELFNKLAADNSRIYKEELLNDHRNDDMLKRIINLALNPFIQFYQKKIPNYAQTGCPVWSLGEALVQLNYLMDRTVTGNAAIDHLTSILCNLDSDDAKVIERIIEKDLKCGVNVATINKVWADLIPTFDVCLCHKDTTHIKYPAMGQIKYDGGRCHLYFDGERATAWSRNGKEIEFHGVFNQYAKIMMRPGETWDGEIVFRNDGKLLDRKTSNGLFNKGVKGTITVEEANNATFICWDIVDTSSTIPYIDRYNEIKSRIDTAGSWYDISNIWIVGGDIVNSPEEAQEYYYNCLKHGHEGAVIKNLDFKWEPKRVKGAGKLKATEEADLIVVGWEEGTGKNLGRLGNLVCETADGKLRVSVGIGFSDEQRNTLTPDNTIGKIVTVQYNQRIKSKGDKLESLFLPRFVEFRLDKDVANTIGELK